MTSTNRAAFLDMIGVSEGTSTSPVTHAHGYDVIVTGVDGPETFTDYGNHPFAHRPAKVINSKGLRSTASGKYQILIADWAYYKALLSLPDFSPASQDLMALQLIRERSALPLIDGGSFDAAVLRCSNLWASFPGAQYGQPTHPIARLRAAYLSAGGVIGSQSVVPQTGYVPWGNEARR